MNRLLNWLTLIIKKQKGLKRWQRVVTVLAAMITFATTYALILPAITVEKNSTEDVGGMYLEKTAKRDDLLEDNALEPVGVSIAADMDNAVSFAYSDYDMTATAIFSTDEIIPEGAELVVNNVTSDSEEYADLSGRAADLLDKEFIYDVTSCSFYDFALVCDNVDVTPKTGLVDIQIIFRNNTNQHVNDVVYVGRFARPSEDSDGFAAMAVSTVEAEAEADDTVSVNGTAVNDNSAGESGNPLVGEDELVSLNIDESSVIELSDGIITSLSLKGSDLSRSDSLVGIIAGYVDEEIKAAAAETDAEIPEYDESQDEDEQRSSGEDASANADNNVSTSPEEDSSGTSAEDERKEITDALQMKTLKASGKDYTVTLTYDESSKIPEGASLTVSEISKDSKEYQTYLEETKKAMGLKEEETLPGLAARFFDIKIMVGGKEFNPESGVSVEITYAEPLAEYSDTEVNAVHFADEKAEAEMIEANTAEVQDDGKATVEFTAESFSVYGVIYTVDFHWEVNGKKYDFSIPGGGFVSFHNLVEMLGILGDTNNSSSAGENEDNSDAGSAEITDAAIDEFLADVESVEFSNPGLVSVSKVEENTTVGAIKDDLGLECEYSAELTEDEIAEINGTEVQAGDWALISVQPFDSTESLIVTMRTGEVFEIKVTDAAVNSLTSGQSYVIYSMTNNGTTYSVLDIRGNYHNFNSLSDLESLGDEYLWTTTYVNGNWTIQSKSTVIGNDSFDYYTFLDINTGHGEANDVVVWKRPYDSNVPYVYVQNNGNNTFYLHGINYNQLSLGFRYANSGNGYVITNQQWAAQMLFYQQTPTFDYTVVTEDSTQGLVSGWSSTNGRQENRTTSIQSTTDTNKKNNTLITAEPTSSKYLFSHWELDGAVVYANGTTQDDGSGTLMGSRIEPSMLTLTQNNQVLKAVFSVNPDISSNVPAKSFDEQALQDWYNLLSQTNPPLTNVNKTAEVYDYQNRIYQIDFTASSSVQTFASDIDLSFIMDVSNSMLFPATLTTLKDGQGRPVSKRLTTSGSNATNLNSLDHNGGQPYFVVGDVGYTSTVYALWYDSGWKFADASEYAKGNSSKYYDISTVYANSNNGRLNATDEWPIYVTSQSYFDGINSHDIYSKNNPAYNRLYYMKDAMETIVEEAKNLTEEAASVGDTSGNSNVRVAWEVFNRTHSKGEDFKSVTDPLNGDANFNAIESALDNTETAGGTRQDRGLEWAINNFSYAPAATTSTKRIAILITDGAPMITGNDSHQNTYTSTYEQGLGNYYTGTTGDGAWLRDQIRNKAATLRKGADGIAGTDDDVTLITIGLGVDRVANAPEWLNEVASELPAELQVGGGATKYFYNVTDTSKLKYVLYDILQTFSASATVDTTVTDVIDEAFYPVDENGNPLGVGDTYTAENGVTGTIGQKQITESGITKTFWTVTWDHETVNWSDHGGWHGSVLVKAKEDFLGGNDINTNSDSTVTANSFIADNSYDVFGPKTVQIVRDNEFKPETPYVNVHELQMLGDSTQWTVYLGEDVDPKAQLKELFKKIRVVELVTETRDDNEDEKPDHKINNGQMLGHGGEGTAETFPLSDVFNLTEEELDDLLDTGFLFKDYNDEVAQAYGHTMGGDDLGIFIFSLTKSDTAYGEEGLENSPHITTVTNEMNSGNPVEEYTLNVLCFPYGSELNPEDFHTGNYVTGTPGREMQSAEADINHIINVYNVSLDVYKTDENQDPLPGATFKLYKVDEENGSAVDGLDSTHKYIEAAFATSGTDGNVRLKDADGEDFDLVLGETYYLMETAAPTVYVSDTTVWVVEVQAENGKFTDLDGNTIHSATSPTNDDNPLITEDMYPFNWNQGARIMLDGNTSVPVIAKGETEGTTTTITDGSFVSYEKVIFFRHTVVNHIETTTIPVEKTWDWSDDDNDKVESWSATFKLQYREVYDSGTPDDEQNVQSLWGYVYDGDNVKEITITNGDHINTGSNTFANLPKYKIHANGSIYRLVYAVEEAEYTIDFADGSSKTWSKDTSGAFDEHYSPIYEEDAGQTGELYSISVTNAPSKERVQNTIDLDIEKIWEGDADGTVSGNSENYAIFQLKRYYHEEYLDLTGYNENDLVKVTLDFGNEKKSVLEVPRGAPVFITTDVKSEGAVNLIFDQTVPVGSTETRSLIYDHDNPGAGNYTYTDGTVGPVVFVYSDVITPDQDQTWTLRTPSGSEPFKYILGGVEGIRPATFEQNQDGSIEVTGEIFDSGFTQEFELNTVNHWKEGWDSLPQVVEVKTTRGEGENVVSYLTTIVYSYYFEEVDCKPTGYYTVFHDHNSGESYGDINARVEASGLTIDAINKPAPETQLYKVDIGKLGGTINPDQDLLPGASFRIKKYKKFAEQQGDVEQVDTSWGTNGEKEATYVDRDPNDSEAFLDNGKFKVDGLVPGDYEIVEVNYPAGYIQTTNKPRFRVIINTETEKLEIVPWNSSESIDVIDATTTNPNIIVVGNTPGAALPNTGGPGTRLFTILGSILVMFAGAMLWRRRRTI